MKKFTLSFLCLFLVLTGVTHAQIPQYYYGGASSPSGGNAYPFGWPIQNMRIQLLYKPSMFNSMPPTGFITAVYFRPYGPITPPSSVTYTNLKVQFATTSAGALTPGSWVSTTSAANYGTYTLSPIVGNKWFKI